MHAHGQSPRTRRYRSQSARTHIRTQASGQASCTHSRSCVYHRCVGACGGSLGRYLSRGTIYVKGRQAGIKKVQQITTKIAKNTITTITKQKIEEKTVATTKKKQQEVTKTTNNQKVRKTIKSPKNEWKTQKATKPDQNPQPQVRPQYIIQQ